MSQLSTETIWMIEKPFPGGGFQTLAYANGNESEIRQYYEEKFGRVQFTPCELENIGRQIKSKEKLEIKSKEKLENKSKEKLENKIEERLKELQEIVKRCETNIQNLADTNKELSRNTS